MPKFKKRSQKASFFIAKKIFISFLFSMKINNIAFRGIHTYDAKVCGKILRIDKITGKDTDFLTNLNIDLEQLKSNVNKEYLDIWQAILKRSINAAKSADKNSFLIGCNNKPCGILVSNNKNSYQFIDYVCTWPYEKNKKAPLAAQTLFLQNYKDFINTNMRYIELYATKYGSAMAKYLTLGFKPYGGDNYTEIMRAKREDIIKVFNRLKETIILTPSGTDKDIDLTEIY